MTTDPTWITEATAAVTEATAAMTEAAAAVTEATVAATEAGMDLESIKEIMDAFDPTALLPELSSLFANLETLCRVAVLAGPVVLIVLGLAYLFLSPKEANYYFGYRCYYGMGSVPAWQFTQRLAGTVLAVLGLVLTIVMVFVSNGFAAMEMTDMVWKTVYCLLWEAGLALAANIGINITATVLFDRRGDRRKKKTK